jgi:hypothetical protein
MNEKSKAKAQFWAYRLSQRLHLLKRSQIELDASLQQCLEHLKNMHPQDADHFFKVGVINNYKGHDVIIRSLDRRLKSRKYPNQSAEEAFIVCHMEGKGDRTIVSLEVSMGKAILEVLIAFLFILTMILFGALSIAVSVTHALFLFPLLLFLGVLVCVVSMYPIAIHLRNEMLEYIVAYMFTIEEKLASEHTIDVMSAPESSQLGRS